MLTAAKVFTIIGIACGWWLVLPIIFGIKTLNWLKAGTKPTAGACVCTLIFVNTLAGIFMLCAKEEDYVKFANEQ